MITWQDVINISESFKTAPVEQQTAILAAVAAELPDTCSGNWGGLLPRGQALLAAHMLTVDRSRGRGAVTDNTEGPISRSYAAPPPGSGEWGQTSYGVEFLRLARTRPTVLGL